MIKRALQQQLCSLGFPDWHLTCSRPEYLRPKWFHMELLIKSEGFWFFFFSPVFRWMLAKIRRIYCKIKVICKEREDPSLTDDIYLDLVITFKGEIPEQVFSPLALLTFGGWVTLCCWGCPVYFGCLWTSLLLPSPPVVTTKNTSRHCHKSCGGQSHTLPTLIPSPLILEN